LSANRYLDRPVVVGSVVDLHLGQPSMCLVTLRNSNHYYNDRLKLGMPVETRIADIARDPASGSAKTAVFKGELVGMEPTYTAAGESVLTLRAHDRLHRLTRGRKSQTYQSQSDQDIVGVVAREHGLSVLAGSIPTIRHAHVYQHNQRTWSSSGHAGRRSGTRSGARTPN
jgi:hypothetical protein